MQKLNENSWKVLKTGEVLTLEKAENTTGQSSVCTAENWEILRFRSFTLKWSDTVTDFSIDVFSGEVPIEFTHSLELKDERDDNTVLIELQVKNMKERSKNAHELHLEDFQPWLDAILGAVGLPTTIQSWNSLCSELQLTSFCPSN